MMISNKADWEPWRHEGRIDSILSITPIKINKYFNTNKQPMHITPNLKLKT